MKRRNFIANSTLVAAGLTTVLGVSCSTGPATKKEPENAGHQTDDFELNEATVQGLQEKMKNGTFTAERITRLYLKRIEDIDKNSAALNAVIELNPDAISIAQAMDAERKAGKVRGSLHGIPVLIKDNIDTADNMMTTAGSLAMLGHKAKEDAFIVKKLRDAGAVLLGKTNLSEWANFRSSKSCSGWSSRGGQTKNPYIIDHNPCGSSSGSGVAVAANLCTVAVGTETDGSVTCPASVNGVVGIKPTVGLLSRSGIIPISYTQDTAGPLARTVTDAAILLTVMAGADATDEKTKRSAGKAADDYTIFLKSGGLKGKKIGIDSKKYDNQFLQRLLQQAVDLMKGQGAEVVEIDYLDKLNALGEAEFDLLKFEFKHGLNKYLATAGAPVKLLSDVITFNKNNEDKAMPTFKQETLEASDKMEGLDSKGYKDALEKSHKGSQKIIDTVMQENKLDALAGLTMGPACSIDIIYGDRWGDVFLTSPAAMSGYPHISVPAGMVYDLPVGLSFFSGAYQEDVLLSIAFDYEQASNHRKLPAFTKSFLK